MTLEEAQKMVDTALQQRKQFGKMFTVEDMPPEFLDALVMALDHVEASAVPREEFEALKGKNEDQHAQIVLQNRQLGAAAARETKLRKQLAANYGMAAMTPEGKQEGP